MKKSLGKTGTEEFTSKTLTIASLFSGVGGWEFAAHNLGMRSLWAVELVPWICDAFELNHGFRPIEQDALTVDFSNLENIDILCASPPCQAFSSSGKQARKTKGTTNTSVSNTDVGMAVVYAARALLPSYVFLENAPAYQHSKVFKTILTELKALGYTVTFKVLNAKNYGVAQSRKRLIMIASLLKEPYSFPNEVKPNLGWASVVQDIISNGELSKGKLAFWQFQGLTANPPSSYPVLVCGGNPNRNTNGYLVHKHSTEPSWTLQLSKNTSGTKVVLADQTVYECSPKFLARLQSFPDKTVWPKEKTKTIHLIGNSIPPLFAEKLLKEATVNQ